MRKLRSGLPLAAWTGLALLCAGPVIAQPASVFPITGPTIGETKRNGSIERAKDFSGIACIESSGFPRHCLLVDDEAQSAQFAVLQENSIAMGPAVRLTSDSFNGKPTEFDAEGVAYADGAFYVIGSHGHPRDKDNTEDRPEDKEKFDAAIQTASVIQRIEVSAADFPAASATSTAAITAIPSRALRADLQAQPDISDFVDARLNHNGLTIEGVAVADGRLYAGLRGPLVDGKIRAAILSVKASALFDGTPTAPRLFKLDLGNGRGIRDLAAYQDGFLVLAGPSADPSAKDPIPADAYSVFWWKPDGTHRRLGDVAGLDKGKDQGKPEALLPLDVTGNQLRLLILFDGVPEARSVTIAAP